MKLYSFNTKDIPKSTSSKDIDQYVLDAFTVSKQTENKFKHNRLLLLGGITLFLIGVYFLVACIFLYASSGISENEYITNRKSKGATVLCKDSTFCNIFYSKRIRNLNSIDYEKDVNPSMGVHARYSANGLLYPNFTPNNWWSTFWVRSQVPINQQTGAVWIHRIQVTFFRPRHTIPSNHLQTNYKTILS